MWETSTKLHRSSSHLSADYNRSGIIIGCADGVARLKYSFWETSVPYSEKEESGEKCFGWLVRGGDRR